MGMKSGVFDLDGTLASTASAHLASWIRALQALGVNNVTIDERQLLGRRATEIASIILSSLKPTNLRVTAEELIALKTKFFEQVVKVSVKPMPCAIELTSAVRKFGGKVIVVTSSLSASARLILGAIGIKPDVLITGDEVERGKPDPEPVLKALSQASLAPSEVFAVGDTINDVEAYWRSGIRDIYLVKGDVPMHYEDELVARFGAKKVESLCDILNVEYPH